MKNMAKITVQGSEITIISARNDNPDFKVVEFDHFKMQAGLPSFVLSTSEWIEKTNAVGIYVKTNKSTTLHLR